MGHLVLHQFVWTAAIMLACAVAILLIGAEYLSWFWLLVVAIISLASGFWLVRNRFPSIYQIAQTLDARLHLSDSLSTATHFSVTPGQADPSIRQAQAAQAEQLAQSVDLKQALPLAKPRALFPAIGLAAAVAGLFLVHYAVQGSFDPRPSLVKSAFDNFFSAPKQQALNSGQRDGNAPGEDSQDKDQSKNADFAGDPQFDPTAPDPQAAPTEAKDQSQDKSKQDDAKGGNNGDPQKGDNNQQADQKQDGNQSGNQDAANQDQSMMDKVKEALNDLVNKMKQGNDPAKNQKGDPASDGEKQQGKDGQSQDKNQGDSADAQKNAQESADGENGKNSAQKKQSNDPQQGVGSQEGDKNTKDAAALKAMGKISELLGKRAENVKGSVTMEVGQTRQQLKTVESARAAQHSEAGSEIHRDQVPPAYEQYVQQYFEQVRKSSSTSTPPPPAASK